MRFDEFLRVAPTVAQPVAQRLDATGLCLLGTVRADGSPRVSPVEVRLHAGELALGMMPASVKLADVVRDPRCSLLTPLAGREDLSGEGKLSGRLVRVTDPARTRELLAVFAPGGDPDVFVDSPVFTVSVTQAAWQYVDGDSWHTLSWRTGAPVRHRRRTGPAGLPVDV